MQEKPDKNRGVQVMNSGRFYVKKRLNNAVFSASEGYDSDAKKARKTQQSRVIISQKTVFKRCSKA